MKKRSIYPLYHKLTAPRVASSCTITEPLEMQEFEVALIDDNECKKEIDYSQIDKMSCNKVGTHIK